MGQTSQSSIGETSATDGVVTTSVLSARFVNAVLTADKKTTTMGIVQPQDNFKWSGFLIPLQSTLRY
jgi:hypothetical protein